ncbi:hypothetical protein G8764_05535 [Pseudomaricurvus alcaniphilus]|nr:DUF1302 family protein [Pseudomaricurvus alcaniphilus]NHN36752.1 hypothetical protein [Pseudomaricurvus alcaniphilus]
MVTMLLVTCQSNAALSDQYLLALDSFDDLFNTEPAEDEPSTADDESTDSAESLFGLADDDSMSNDIKSPVTGFIQFEAAHTYPSPSHTSKARSILHLSTNGNLDNGMSWNLSGRATYDAVFDLTNHYPGEVRDDRDLYADVHEAYLDIPAGDVEFRLGRQHIVWGEMVGLFFADVVSAKDMRQFVAQDFDQIRIPQWAARAEYFGSDFHSEFIWIPYMTYNDIGVPGDDFYPLSIEPPANVALRVNKPKEPSRDLSNSSFGLRGSMLKGGWDISAFYYRSINVDPTFFIETDFTSTPTVIVTPEHTRIHQFGATLAKDFGPFVLKSEAVYNKNTYINIEDLTIDNGVIQQDILDYIVAIEHTTANNTLLNFQFYQRWYTDHDDKLMFDEFESGVSVYSKVEINDTLEAELTLITQLNRSDWMARPRVTWEFSRNWYVQAGADIFGGQDVGIFGRFEDSSRVYTNLRYTF